MENKKEYVKLWVSYETYFEAYSDAELGRLLRAMIQYKTSGVEPAFSGNERFIWPAIQRDIDEAAEAQERMANRNRRNGQRGGRPSRAKQPAGLSETQTDPENPVGFLETQTNPENPVGFLETQKSQGQRTKDKGLRSKDSKEKASLRTPKRNAPIFPPSEQDVKDYACETGAQDFDAGAFVDYYAARGWNYANGTPMADWRAAVRSWLRRETPRKKASPSSIAPRRPDADMAKYIQAMQEQHDSGGERPPPSSAGDPEQEE